MMAPAAVGRRRDIVLARLPFFRREQTQAQRMHAAGQFIFQQGMNGALAINQLLTVKGAADHHHAKMGFGIGRHMVHVAFVLYLQPCGSQCLKFLFDLLLNAHVHALELCHSSMPCGA
ncbi:uracil DNA glycosylase [Zymobacter palmae]|uniref:Uracil DNA glycosylase n=1 Tax=Zymobacter palmae TaxID=33074 RepID=A0A348HCB3_9GAMM|nr:uracil DNA glycosylase [Zymobacter palmae]